jgi:CheY-like chemotaxis protein
MELDQTQGAAVRSRYADGMRNASAHTCLERNMPSILVIEHNLAVRAAIKLVLEHEGFEVTLADSPEAGLISLESQSFDLAIVDVLLPDGQGAETVKRLNHHAPRLPVVVIYGHLFRNRELAAPDSSDMNRPSGAVHALQRPFRPNDLIKAIRSCLDCPHSGSRDPWPSASGD